MEQDHDGHTWEHECGTMNDPPIVNVCKRCGFRRKFYLHSVFTVDENGRRTRKRKCKPRKQ